MDKVPLLFQKFQSLFSFVVCVRSRNLEFCRFVYGFVYNCCLMQSRDHLVQVACNTQLAVKLLANKRKMSYNMVKQVYSYDIFALLFSPFSTPHVLQVIFHITQLVLGYVMMLVVMTFNVWLGVAVVLGLGTGYFICHNEYILPVVSNATTSIQLKIVE